MKNIKYRLILFLFILSSMDNQRLSAQNNFVVNGDFESYSTCPTFYSTVIFNQISYCGWYFPSSGTSDYFNTCSLDTIVAVPRNFRGFQNANSGNGYVGGYFFHLNSIGENQREYLLGPLTGNLVANKNYNVNLYVSLADTSTVAIKNIGVAFKNEFDSLDTFFLPNTTLNLIPTVEFESDSFYTDKLNWIQLTGSFTAKGDEKFIVIGNFNPSTTDTIRVKPKTINEPLDFAYYYVDDVSINEEQSELDPCLFDIPNVISANNDGVNDSWPGVSCSDLIKVEIMNRWGNTIFESSEKNEGWDGTTKNGEKCSDGIYYYVITTTTKTAHGFIHLIND